MNRLLLGSMIALAPFAALGQNPVVGNAILAGTDATSTAGVVSTRSTQAAGRASGNGGVLIGGVPGNMTSVQTSALGTGGLDGPSSPTAAQQYTVGGSVGFGPPVYAAGKSVGPLPKTGMQVAGASGSALSSQASMVTGTAAADAANR